MTPPEAEEPSMEKPESASSVLARYIEPATFLTIALATTYFIGWSYIDGYFERLGIQHVSMEFPTSFYLTEAFWPGMLACIVVFLFYIGSRHAPRNTGEALIGNYLLLLPIVGLVLSAWEYKGSRVGYVLLASAAGVVVLAGVLTSKRISLPHKGWSVVRLSLALPHIKSESTFWRLVALFIVALMLSILARFL